MTFCHIFISKTMFQASCTLNAAATQAYRADSSPTATQTYDIDSPVLQAAKRQTSAADHVPFLKPASSETFLVKESTRTSLSKVNLGVASTLDFDDDSDDDEMLLGPMEIELEATQTYPLEDGSNRQINTDKTLPATTGHQINDTVQYSAPRASSDTDATQVFDSPSADETVPAEEIIVNNAPRNSNMDNTQVIFVSGNADTQILNIHSKNKGNTSRNDQLTQVRSSITYDSPTSGQSCSFYLGHVGPLLSWGICPYYTAVDVVVFSEKMRY